MSDYLPDSDELVRRAIAGIRRRSMLRGRSGGVPLWSKVMDAFGLGSAPAKVLCRKHGFDPDLLVRRT